MLKNYIVTALRNIRKNKLTSSISVIGFSIGIAAALFIFLYARYELSFDKFLPGHERVYRLLLRANDGHGGDSVTATLNADIKLPLLSQNGGIESLTQTAVTSAVLGYQDKSFFEENAIYQGDASFFRVFGYPLERGDPRTALEKPMSIVVSRGAARKYFGDEDPIGKVIRVRNTFAGDSTYECVVTGVLGRLPADSTFRFDFVINVPFDQVRSDVADFYNRAYGLNLEAADVQVQTITYVKLASAAAYPAFKRSLAAALSGSSMERLRFRYKTYELTSESLDDIHLFSPATEPSERRGNFTMILLLVALALAVILIACINVINLTTARAMTRMKEIGIRKTLGATRKELVAQYLVESVLLCLVSLWIAAASVELLLPSFNALFATDLRLSYAGDPAYWVALVLAALLIGLLSGLYPAFFLSSSDIVKVLKGQRNPSSRKFREGMVILQFSISIGLFILSSVILREFESIKRSDLGFESADTVLVRLNIPEIERKFPNIKKRLQSLPGVLGVSASSFSAWKFGYFAKDIQLSILGQRTSCDIMVVDPDFLKLQRISLVKGRDFDPSFDPSAGGQLIANETAARSFGLDAGTFIRSESLVGQVIGVVKDFDYLFPSGKIHPLIMTTLSPFLVNNSFAPVPIHLNYALIKIDPSNRAQVLAAIEKAWKEMSSGYAFEYKLEGEEIARQLDEANLAFTAVLNVCTVLAFALSGLGLFGLATYEIERRTKEVGIRKALGATSAQIAGHFLLRFFRLAAIANLIAWPLTFALIRLTFAAIQYPHALVIGPLAFVEAGLVTFAITTLTVGAQTLRAASANPVNALRYE